MSGTEEVSEKSTRASAPIVETFNTHSMTTDVVNAVATGRVEELEHIMSAITRAAASPEKSPQPMIVYGERGSGKSFLMRMVEIAGSDLPNVACVLLPEELFNIRSASQIIEAVTARVRGDDWVSSAYRFDSRPPSQAWDEAVSALHAALDKRFGAGRGMAIALIENFDTLVQKLFGGATKPATGNISQAELDRRSSEERLRKLINTRNGRFMLIATATGTVDLDYERPLFQLFRIIDLNPWNSETSIDYFNKRRALENLPPLDETETARARAIIDFIGGNPRLAQLLGNVLSSPDAHSIADTLDRLSDQLADYYRRRLDDLPPAAAGLLDALIRGGEPRSQSELAELIGAKQNQIADAFSFLTRSRLVSATAERDGSATLYRVRDRLFVHFYRRRYGDGMNSQGLAPIAELLERFYTAKEREAQILRHLELGEFADARAFGRLSLGVGGVDEGFCGYRDSIVTPMAINTLRAAGLKPEDVAAAQQQLREHPDEAFKEWGERANAAPTLILRVAALVLQARAASRQSLDPIARTTLRKAIDLATDDEASDALILAQSELSKFEWYRAHDTSESIRLARGLETLLDRCASQQARITCYLDTAFVALTDGHALDGEKAAEKALEIATRYNEQSAVRALLYLVWSYGIQGRHEDALPLLKRAEATASATNNTVDLAEIRRTVAFTLGHLGKLKKALVTAEDAVTMANHVGDVSEEANSLGTLGWIELKLGRFEGAIEHLQAAIAIAERVPDWAEVSADYRLKSTALSRSGSPALALESARFAITAAHKHGYPPLLHHARCIFFSRARDVAAPDIVTEFEAALKYSPTARDPDFSVFVSSAVAAVARVDLWHELLCAIRGIGSRRIEVTPNGNAFEAVGKVWSDRVQAQGRASVFADIANTIQDLAAVMSLLPGSPESNIERIAGGLATNCQDSGFLRDIADLFESTFGKTVAASATRLRHFAEFHAAPDEEKVLQRLDPDLATAIRRIWHKSEPSDKLQKRGRKRAR